MGPMPAPSIDSPTPAPSTDSPTPAPSTDSPTPAPTPATTGLCKKKCFTQKKSWSNKCKKKYCAGCDACASTCAKQCTANKPWKQKKKCKKARCSGCAECAGLFQTEIDEPEMDMDKSDIDDADEE